MRITVSQCAHFAKIAYDGARPPSDPAARSDQLGGYEEFCNYNVPSGSHQVVIRGWKKGADVVIAVKGTSPTNIGDLLSDEEIAFGSKPAQYYQAENVLRLALAVAPGNVVLTGHSLGGNIAQHLAARGKGLYRCVTFNAPGMNSPRSLNKLKVSINIVDRWDLVRRAGFRHFGKTYILRTMFTPALSAHSMDRIVKNVEANEIGPMLVNVAISHFG